MSAIQYVEVGGAAPYRIAIGPGLLKAPALLAECLRGRHALVASDGNVAPLYLHRVEAALRGVQIHAHDAIGASGFE